MNNEEKAKKFDKLIEHLIKLHNHYLHDDDNGFANFNANGFLAKKIEDVLKNYIKIEKNKYGTITNLPDGQYTIYYQLDKNTKKILHCFDSEYKLSKWTHFNRKSFLKILKCCKGEQNHTLGYCWKSEIVTIKDNKVV